MTRIVEPEAYLHWDRDLPLLYEKELTDLFQSVRGDVFVDAGAHLGTWTLRLAHQFRHVLAFEPHTEASAALLEHVRLNNLTNVTVSPKALSLQSGIATLVLYDVPGHSALEATTTHVELLSGTLDVETIAIDDLDLPGRLALLKSDVEGNEVLVLQGAAKTIARDRPSLCIECHSVTLQEQCLEVLARAGLNDCRIFPDTRVEGEAGYIIRGSDA